MLEADPPDFWSGKRAWDLPRRNRFRVLAVADSSDDRASSPAHDDDDDGAAVAVDATAVASGAADVAVAAAVVAAVGIDTGMDIGIGTAATGTGIDIGDWAGVFGAAGLPGPAVPYRWDDMYHQKPGLAVCLHVVFNHFVPSFVRHCSYCGQRDGATLSLVFLTSSSFASGPTVFRSVSFFLSLYSSLYSLSNRLATDWSPRESSILDEN